jgi:hypothetical protein
LKIEEIVLRHLTQFRAKEQNFGTSVKSFNMQPRGGRREERGEEVCRSASPSPAFYASPLHFFLFVFENESEKKIENAL